MAKAKKATIRDRIKDFRRVKASSLALPVELADPSEKAQQDALRGVLAEIGYADALLARELPDGTLELVDGHLRAETTPDMEVPVLVLDLDQDEAKKLMAVLDPLASMAEANEKALESLLAEIQTDSEAIQAMLDGLAKENGIAGEKSTNESGEADEQIVEDKFSLVVECTDETDQQALYNRLKKEGRTCQPLTL